MEKLSFKQVLPRNDIDIFTIQSIYEASLGYFQIVQGCAPAKDAAQNDLMAIPKGSSLEYKFFYTIYYNKIAIGCMDLIKGYPNQKTVFIGLLLFIESHQHLGLGVEALDFIIQLTQKWGCDRLRIAVVETNKRAHAFWLREGFIEIYRKDKNDNHMPVIVMEKKLKI